MFLVFLVTDVRADVRTYMRLILDNNTLHPKEDDKYINFVCVLLSMLIKCGKGQMEET